MSLFSGYIHQDLIVYWIQTLIQIINYNSADDFISFKFYCDMQQVILILVIFTIDYETSCPSWFNNDGSTKGAGFAGIDVVLPTGVDFCHQLPWHPLKADALWTQLHPNKGFYQQHYVSHGGWFFFHTPTPHSYASKPGNVEKAKVTCQDNVSFWGPAEYRAPGNLGAIPGSAAAVLSKHWQVIVSILCFSCHSCYSDCLVYLLNGLVTW